MVVEDSHLNAITANMISANLDEGVLIEAFNRPNADGNWLTGNTIADNGLSGVRIEDADENLRRPARIARSTRSPATARTA